MPEDVIPSEVEAENEMSALDAESNEIESTASDDFADIKEN